MNNQALNGVLKQLEGMLLEFVRIPNQRQQTVKMYFTKRTNGVTHLVVLSFFLEGCHIPYTVVNAPPVGARMEPVRYMTALGGTLYLGLKKRAYGIHFKHDCECQPVLILSMSDKTIVCTEEGVLPVDEETHDRARATLSGEYLRMIHDEGFASLTEVVV